jgi:hypothetical protein
MAVSQAERTAAPAKHSNGGEFLLVGGILAATLGAAIWFANQGSGSSCNPACDAGQTCSNGTCVGTCTCGNCPTGVASCIGGMPAGSLVQDPTSTISIVNPAGQRQGFTDITLVNACGYDLDRLVQISSDRREAIPLGTIISTTGICPPQSSEESAPVGV